jgi:hypothetical protein
MVEVYLENFRFNINLMIKLSLDQILIESFIPKEHNSKK